MRVIHDDGPYSNFSDVESHTIFGYIPIEPVIDNHIKAFGSNKISEKSDTVDGCRHVQVEICFTLS